jgi:hypothetical protein
VRSSQVSNDRGWGGGTVSPTRVFMVWVVVHGNWGGERPRVSRTHLLPPPPCPLPLSPPPPHPRCHAHMCQDCESLSEVLDLLVLQAIERPEAQLTAPLDSSFFSPTRDIVDNDREYVEQTSKQAVLATELQVRTALWNGWCTAVRRPGSVQCSAAVQAHGVGWGVGALWGVEP